MSIINPVNTDNKCVSINSNGDIVEGIRDTIEKRKNDIKMNKHQINDLASMVLSEYDIIKSSLLNNGCSESCFKIGANKKFSMENGFPIIVVVYKSVVFPKFGLNSENFFNLIINSFSARIDSVSTYE